MKKTSYKNQSVKVRVRVGVKARRAERIKIHLEEAATNAVAVLPTA
jgi:anti-sigma regulatory factor (Ser/Thr protein kinase)